MSAGQRGARRIATCAAPDQPRFSALPSLKKSAHGSAFFSCFSVVWSPSGKALGGRPFSSSGHVTGKSLPATVGVFQDNATPIVTGAASGYVLKGVSARELASVVRSVSAGEVYVAPSLAFGLLREMSQERTTDPLAELSSRERQVLELVANGLSNQEIGVKLGLAEKTIKHYMTNILTKLQVRSRVEAALLAARVGLGQPGPPQR